MEITTTSSITWRIEPKPEGGYIARCSDASVPPIEGASEAEVRQKVRDTIAAEITSKVPGVKLAFDKAGTKLISFNTMLDFVSPKSADVSPQTAKGGIKGAIEHWLTENAMALVEGQIPPEALEKLKAQAHHGKLNFTLTTTTKGHGGSEVHTKTISFDDGKSLTIGSPDQKATGALQPSAPVSASFSNPQLDSGSPITPVTSSNSFLRFLLAALVVVGLVFLFTHLKK